MSARLKKLLCALLLVVAGVTCPAWAAEPQVEPLTKAAAVLALSGEQAGQRLKVTVTGVVTAAEPDWSGQFFVQDETAGVFVENLNRPAPVPGDVIALEGVTHPGAFAPIVSAPQWRRLGSAPLPEPRLVAIEDLQTGAEDSQRVEISGVVRTVRIEAGRLLIDLVVVGNRLQVHAQVPPGVPVESLVGARVRVRGTAATHYIGALRHMTAAAVYVPRLEDLIVIEQERRNPFEEEIMPVRSIGQYRSGRRAEQRVHVRGVVTLQRTHVELYLQDDSGGIRILAEKTGPLAAGDLVEAVGFIEYEGHLPLLRDAVLRPATGPKPLVAPRPVPFEEIESGQHNGELVTLRGRVLDRASRPEARPERGGAGVVTNWLVQGSGTSFTIEPSGPTDSAALAEVPVGSLIEADGVCVTTVDAVGKFTSLRLLMPATSRLRVLERPSWLTPGRLLTGLGVVSAVLVLAIAWLLTVAKKNAALRRVVSELEQAQRELQEAHDTLEQKVAERSAQLQVEMTARKTSELQFKAVLTERTRLARDLHDTLEQTLAGIALRLNAVAKFARRDSEAFDEHLQLARNWLHQSQVDLRRSIWDLRSRELEQFDLAGALRASADQLVNGTDMALDFQVVGAPENLPEVVEENVLRIGQEALTNIAKHAHATRVTVRLEFDPRVLRLRLEDNGVGFDRTHLPADGHFGLMGMTERAKRLAGGIVIQSAPDRGTILTVEIPLQPAAGAARVEETLASSSPEI